MPRAMRAAGELSPGAGGLKADATTLRSRRPRLLGSPRLRGSGGAHTSRRPGRWRREDDSRGSRHHLAARRGGDVPSRRGRPWDDDHPVPSLDGRSRRRSCSPTRRGDHRNLRPRPRVSRVDGTRHNLRRRDCEGVLRLNRIGPARPGVGRERTSPRLDSSTRGLPLGVFLVTGLMEGEARRRGGQDRASTGE